MELFANSGDPDQTLLNVASVLGLQGLPITLLGVSRLQWVNSKISDNEIIFLLFSQKPGLKTLKQTFY